MLQRIRSHHNFMIGYTRAVLSSFTQPILVYLTVTSGTLILGFALMFFILERSNPNLNNFLDAVYFAVATMTTVGFGDITPITAMGKLASISAMLVGTALFVSFTAVLASSIIEVELITETKTDEKEGESSRLTPPAP